MKEEVKKLWEVCFDDKKEFIDLYFDKRYSENINVAISEQNKVVSALQMIPYDMTYHNMLIPVSYISGACTHPDFRSKGIMKQLLDKTHQRMYENGILISTLIPAENWLFDYYEKVGYVPAFYYVKKLSDLNPNENESSLSIERFQTGQTDVYPYFNRKMMERDCCIQHSEEDFEIILRDLHISNGELFVARQQHQVVGLVFCIPDKGTLYISEVIADSLEIQESLINQIAKQTGSNKIKESIASNIRDGFPKGMIRIINAEALMHLYARAHKNDDVTFEISDEHISQNNGVYSLKNGICTRLPLSSSKENRIQMNIDELAWVIFKNEPARMSLMLD